MGRSSGSTTSRRAPPPVGLAPCEREKQRVGAPGDEEVGVGWGEDLGEEGDGPPFSLCGAAWVVDLAGRAYERVARPQLLSPVTRARPTLRSGPSCARGRRASCGERRRCPYRTR